MNLCVNNKTWKCSWLKKSNHQFMEWRFSKTVSLFVSRILLKNWTIFFILKFYFLHPWVWITHARHRSHNQQISLISLLLSCRFRGDYFKISFRTVSIFFWRFLSRVNQICISNCDLIQFFFIFTWQHW